MICLPAFHSIQGLQSVVSSTGKCLAIVAATPNIDVKARNPIVCKANNLEEILDS